jgi:hypothetical protein
MREVGVAPELPPPSPFRKASSRTPPPLAPDSARTLSPAVVELLDPVLLDLALRCLPDGRKGGESHTLIRLHEL